MKLLMILISCMLLCGCATWAPVTPLPLKPITTPAMTAIKQPDIPALIEGTDFWINDKGNVEYSPMGQAKITAQVLSRKMAWEQVEQLKQLVQLYADLAQRYQDWVIEVDLQRQVSERYRVQSEMRTIIAEIIAIFGIGVVGAVALF